MRLSRNKKIIIVILLLVGALTYYYVPIESTFLMKSQNFEEEKNPSEELSKESVNEDVKQIVDIVEDTHPIFLNKDAGDEIAEYNNRKEELLKNTNKDMSVDELTIEISKYLSSINDGHTRLKWPNNGALDVNWKYVNERLMIVDSENNITNKEVKKINDTDISEIINNINLLFPAENYSGESLNVEEYSKDYTLLKYSKVDISKDIELTVRDDNDNEEKINVKFLDENSTVNNKDKEISSKIIEDNIFYIKLEKCEVNDDLNNVIENMKKSVDEGISNVIVDVRGNGGGNSEACSKILKALNMQHGSYGTTIRFSKLSLEMRGTLRNFGSVNYRSNNEAVKNDNINLYVLTDEETFSSATMLAVWVQDGKLGTVVGTASSNKPSSYGDVIAYQLKNSKILGQISFKQWKRPDSSKDNEDLLKPDIKVEYNEDSLDAALKHIKNNS